MSDRFVRRLAERITRLERSTKATSSPQLAYSSIEDGAIDEYDAAGNLVGRTGKQYDGTHAAVSLAGPPPPNLAGVTAVGGSLTFTTTWPGAFADGAVAPMDWARAEVHASPVADYEADPLPGSATRVGTIETAAGGSLTASAAAGDLYVRVLARSLSGKVSAATPAVKVTVTAAADTAMFAQLTEDLAASQARITEALTGPVDGVRITNESITAPKINAQSVAGAVGAFIQLDVSKLTASSASIGEAVVAKLWADVFSANKITANEINAASIASAVGEFVKVKAENIKAGNVDVALNITAGGSVTAGNAEMGKGFRTFGVNADGEKYPTTQMGVPDSPDSWSVIDQKGNPVASISGEGDISGRNGNFGGDVTIGGSRLLGKRADPTLQTLGWLDQQAWGLVGRWDLTGLSTFGASIINTTTMLGQFEFTLTPQRSYEIRMPYRVALAINGSPAPAQCVGSVRAYLTYTTDGTAPPNPTTSSALIADSSDRVPAVASTGSSGLLVVTLPIGGNPGDVIRVKVGIAAFAGAGTRFVPNTFGGNSWVASVTDVGPNQLILAAAEPGASAKQKYVTTWPASNSRSYANNGAIYKPSDPTDLIRQGNSGSTIWHGAFCFGWNATSGDETGKRLADAIGSSATILKAEIFVQVTWAEYTTPQIELRPLGTVGTTVPLTMASPPVITAGIVKYDFPARVAGAWFEVPTSWFSGSNNGVIVASPDWLFGNTNAMFAGSTHGTPEWRPKLRLTYTR